MPLDRHRKNDEDEEEPENFWRGLVWDLLIAAIIVILFLGAMYAYAGVWPPLVVVESASMQHSDRESFLGVIDTGDMVFQQAAPTRSFIITYLEGRASGYATYGDYGDVIIFNRPGNPTPVIHRAIMYLTLHYTNRTADVPDLARLPTSDWDATNATGPTTSPYGLQGVTIHGMGWMHGLDIRFDFASPIGGIVARVQAAYRDGRSAVYVTMGDNNAPGYDLGWFPIQADIIGRARGEIPWFGLLKLTLAPTESCCSDGWGDIRAPKNSWDSLLVSLIFLLALPFILEYAARGWTKYVAPRLPDIRWPWLRKAKAGAGKGSPENPANGPDRDRKKRSKEPPKEESSES